MNAPIAKFMTVRQLQNSIKGVTPAKAGVQKFLKRLDSRCRGNDNRTFTIGSY